MNTINENATAYAERVCNGQFPITYSREQVVKHTANDFQNGWDESIEANKPDWFKAGGMAERILIDWEMKQLKEKLQQEKFESATKDISLDSIIAERDELKHRCKALEDRISIITKEYGKKKDQGPKNPPKVKNPDGSDHNQYA